MPLAATAAPGRDRPGASGNGDVSYVSKRLKDQAKATPDALVSIIVQVDPSSPNAEKAARKLGKFQRKLGLIGAITLEVTAKQVDKLSKIKGLIVTEDSPVMVSGQSSTQLWPYANGSDRLWGTSSHPAPNAPAIAIVDSGVDASHPSFGDGSRVEQVTITSLPNNSPGDGRGHGTFVAGIAAGGAAGKAGASPKSRIISLDVMDDNGMAKTSDVIAAAEWIYQNKDAKNIRVANFSLHATNVAPFYNDPLDRAVEKLWFSGVVVVAAAGNYGSATGPSGVRYAPGNDPFVITVGAIDLGGSARPRDDFVAPWSAWGRTYDGFAKPDLVAAGRYMVGPIPMGSTLASVRASSIVSPGYIQLSGTSFSAPVVAGVAAQVLARHPGWTPDQVKGALMKTARPMDAALPMQSGVGEINASRAATGIFNPPNPNRALDQFVGTDAVNGGLVFNSVSWTDVSWTDVSWDSVSWSDVSWTDVSWDSVSWSDVSWSDVSWTDVSWSDVSWEDVATGDINAEGGVPLTEEELAAALADPDLMTPEEAAAAAQAAADAAAAQAAADAAAAAAAAAANPDPPPADPPPPTP